MMIPHHQQAVDMSEFAQARTQTPEVLELAEQISRAQGPEIEEMRAWLTAVGISDHMDDHMDDHAGHGGMDGMLSEEELKKLEAASGAEFDKLFLESMIEHHLGAIEMTRPIENSSNPRVAKLAKAIIETQQQEIELMRELLKNY
jgi:uncharacterized protein (DUF305 family)